MLEKCIIACARRNASLHCARRNTSSHMSNIDLCSKNCIIACARYVMCPKKCSITDARYCMCPILHYARRNASLHVLDIACARRNASSHCARDCIVPAVCISSRLHRARSLHALESNKVKRVSTDVKNRYALFTHYLYSKGVILQRRHLSWPADFMSWPEDLFYAYHVPKVS